MPLLEMKTEVSQLAKIIALKEILPFGEVEIMVIIYTLKGSLCQIKIVKEIS